MARNQVSVNRYSKMTQEDRAELVFLRRELKLRTDHRTPQQWISLIEKIDGELIKIKIASMIFWDYFGDMINAKEAHFYFDKYLEKWQSKCASVQINPDQVIKALVFLGFPYKIAEIRGSIRISNNVDDMVANDFIAREYEDILDPYSYSSVQGDE